jgi:uncharacterized membrane protein YozB (DUF420 family)
MCFIYLFVIHLESSFSYLLFEFSSKIRTGYPRVILHTHCFVQAIDVNLSQSRYLRALKTNSETQSNHSWQVRPFSTDQSRQNEFVARKCSMWDWMLPQASSPLSDGFCFRGGAKPYWG